MYLIHLYVIIYICILQGLEPDSEYEFQLYSVNEHGDKTALSTFIFHTVPGEITGYTSA